ncbi:MAG TPA: DUF2283 domain-containing protein [Candidatus Kapabacteria bacterium]|nr:DUF2283 domain-containing protein [Candidatus Kapabacteria bacterium]
MKITYFQDTDTLFVEFADRESEETRDLDENTLAEYDKDGNLIAITLEHASARTDLKSFTYSNLDAIAA